MGIVTPGFFGRRREAAPKLPPGQYLVSDFPVLSAGPTPNVHLDTWTFTITAEDGQAHSWTLGRAAGAGGRGHHRRPALRHQVVPARHGLPRRLAGHALRKRRDRSRVRARALLRRLHDQPAARGPDGRSRPGSPSATTATSCRPSTAARPGCWCRTSTCGSRPSGSAASSCATTTSRASGRRSAITTTETHGASSGTGATDLAGRHPGVGPQGEPDRAHADLRGARAGRGTGRASTSTSGSPRRTATRPSGRTRSPRSGTRPPTAPCIDLTVEEVEDGEVSPFLVEVLRVGDPIELRGPVGGWFVWRPGRPGADPAGRRRQRDRAADGDAPGPPAGRQHGRPSGWSTRCAPRSPRCTPRSWPRWPPTAPGSRWSSSTPARRRPAGPARVGRVQPAQLLAGVGGRPAESAFVCGPTGFVEAVADVLAGSGTGRAAGSGPSGSDRQEADR